MTPLMGRVNPGERISTRENYSSISLITFSKCAGDDKMTCGSTETMYLVKIPTSYIRNLQESAIFAIEELRVDEKTKFRDALDLQVEDKLPQNKILGSYYRYVKHSESIATHRLSSKLRQVRKLEKIIDKAEKSISIEHFNSQICHWETFVQLEEVELEDKQRCTLEINQLKRRRENLSYLLDREEDKGIKQILELKEEAEESLKIVQKEIEILRDRALEAKAIMLKFQKKNDDAMHQIEQLQRQYRIAAHVCQEAIAYKESIEKSYRDKMLLLGDCGSNAVLAHLYVASADRVGLSRYCKNNVEKFMKRWNKDEEFRREYAKFNESSTITRFGSLDGARSHVHDNKHGSKKCKRNNRNKKN